MYFDDSLNLDLDNLLNDKYTFYAHLSERCKVRETLKEHTSLTINYFKKIIVSKNIDKAFENFEKNILKEYSNEAIILFRKMLISIPMFHDIGKINPLFQTRKMNNNEIKSSDVFSNSNHSNDFCSFVCRFFL